MTLIALIDAVEFFIFLMQNASNRKGIKGFDSWKTFFAVTDNLDKMKMKY